MKACRAGHLCTVQFLISKLASLNRNTTNNDHTPLSLACAGGHLAVVELLLAQSADPFHKLKVIYRYNKLFSIISILSITYFHKYILSHNRFI